MKPIVSIIIPTYNHEKYISMCIESVLKQTFQNWEIIIIDDNSTDKTYEIAKNYINDKRIKLLKHRENYGKEKLYLTHNEALYISQGELIAILEGDDYWPEYRLEIQVKTFEKEQIILSHGEIAYNVKGKNVYFARKRNWSLNILKNDPVGSILKPFLYGENPIYSQSVMVKKEILEKIGGFKQFPGLYLVDYSTWMEFAFYGKFSYIPEILGYWRRHSESITLLYEEELWLGIKNYIGKFIKEKEKILTNLPVKLDKYITCQGVYTTIALYKKSVINGEKLKARKYFDEILRKKRVVKKKEILKILILYILLFIPYSWKLYKKYIVIRTKS